MRQVKGIWSAGIQVDTGERENLNEGQSVVRVEVECLKVIETEDGGFK